MVYFFLMDPDYALTMPARDNGAACIVLRREQGQPYSRCRKAKKDTLLGGMGSVIQCHYTVLCRLCTTSSPSGTLQGWPGVPIVPAGLLCWVGGVVSSLAYS